MVALRKPPELSLGTTARLVVLMLGVCAVLGFATRKSFTDYNHEQTELDALPCARPRPSSWRCAEAGECTSTSLFFANLR